jgi:hypothetical protein
LKLDKLVGMAESGKEQKNVFKQIFEDGWDDFKSKYPRYEAVDEVVQKMLGCGNPENGHAVYLCPGCLAGHEVGFSCKSTFCLSCAKVYGQAWVETVKGMLHPGMKYRHLILTVPEGLRTLIYQHPSELLDGLVRAAMDEAVGVVKGRGVEMGYIVVLQTAGRVANYNPHLHVLMTDGGLTEEGEWQALGYIPYEVLHRKWQWHVLEMVKTRLAGDVKAAAVVAEMWAKYPKGFVAHLKGDIVPRLSELAWYIVKYVVSPPKGLSRIIQYDRERGEVTYWYKDHLSRGKKTTVTVDRETFIGRMVQHILPKGFQRIRYYGLQATCKLEKVREQLKIALEGAAQLVMESGVKPVKRLTYRERMKRTLGRDPQQCPQCGAELWLWKVWHPKYKVIYDAGERLRREAEVQYERTLPTGRGRTSDAGVGGGSHLQLSLFAVQP